MTLRFITWNVRHGSAALVLTPNGQTIAIDLGADAGFSPLQHIKFGMGIDRLDKVIITHPHMDHIEDILSFDVLKPRILMRPRQLNAEDISRGHGTMAPDAVRIFRKYHEIDARYSSPVQTVYDPSAASANGGVKITTYFPRRSPKTNLNNHSIVTVIEYEGVKILSPGDNERPSWEELLGNPAFKQDIKNTHVLVAPHHGRESGFHAELFEHISPLLTIVSDGRKVDTSATDRYSTRSKGWDVRRRNGTYETRKCVTTRNDGTIETIISPRLSSIGSLQVTID